LPRSPLELQGSFLVFASFNYRKTLVDGALEVLIERFFFWPTGEVRQDEKRESGKRAKAAAQQIRVILSACDPKPPFGKTKSSKLF
jgi:hypothetical protein